MLARRHMSDKPPLDFTIVLGSIRPANDAAREALAALGNGKRVSAKITRATANTRRMGLYWAVAAKAAENLGDAIEGGMNAELLHRITKAKLHVGRTIRLPSGAEHFDEASISFARMSEPDRAAYVNRAFDLWAKWLGTDPQTLLEHSTEFAP